VQLTNGIADRWKPFRAGLDEQQPFPVGLDLTPPAIDGFNPRDNIYAGSELELDETVRNFMGLILGPGCRQDDSFVSHIKSAISPAGRWLSAFGETGDLVQL
jgi:hypothetical protein